MNAPKPFKILAGIGIGAFCLLFLLLVGLFVLLQTDSGKTFAAAQLSSLLSSRPDRQVVFGKLEGLFPFRIHLDRVAVSDPQGEWLIIEDALLQWSPAGLVHRQVLIRELTAASVRLDRLPAGPSEEPASPSEPFAFPKAIERLIH